jgi:predicted oxidoreductase
MIFSIGILTENFMNSEHSGILCTVHHRVLGARTSGSLQARARARDARMLRMAMLPVCALRVLVCCCTAGAGGWHTYSQVEPSRRHGTVYCV